MAFDESDPVAIKNAKCLRATARALLVRINGRELWVPKSAVHDDSEVFDAVDNATGKLVIVGWWAEENKIG